LGLTPTDQKITRDSAPMPDHQSTEGHNPLKTITNGTSATMTNLMAAFEYNNWTLREN
jgi:hypothetical protein